jgi:tetratricopeptide (TPR) repeat protein
MWANCYLFTFAIDSMVGIELPMKKITLVLLLLFIFPVLSDGNNKAETLKDSLSYFDGQEKARALLTIGNYYFPNNNDSALFYVESALQAYQSVGDDKGIASCYGLIGAIYNSYAMYDTAIALTYRVMEWGEKNNDFRAFIAYLTLANIYESIGQIENAKKFYLKAIEGSYADARTAAYANMGLLSLKNEQYDSAAFYFRGALDEYLKADTSLPINQFNIATVYSNLARVDFGKGNYERGIGRLYESLKIFRKIGNTQSITEVYLKLGEGYASLHQDEHAINYYLEAKRIADSIQIPSIQEAVYYQLFTFYKQKGDLENALYYHIAYEKIHNELMTLGYKATIAEKEVKYKVQEKINKIEMLEKENSIIVAYAITTVLGILLLSLVVVLVLNHRRLLHKKNQELTDMKLRFASQKAKNDAMRMKKITLSLHEKSDFIKELQEEINKLSNKEDQKLMEKKIEALRETKILTDADWREYNRVFEEIYPSFSKKIKDYEELSTGDKRQLIFLKLGLKQSEIAQLMGISPESAKKAKQRLSKKIGLKTTRELTKFIESI